jgi:hypothetical protein
MLSDARRLCLLILLTVGLAACAPNGTAARPAPDPGRPPWTVELHLSGAIAGRDEELSVDSSAAFRYADHRRGLDRNGVLAPKQRDKIAGMLAGLAEEAGSGQAGWFNERCRDCLVIRLTWQRAGPARTVRLSSDRLGRSPYRELIAALLTFTDEHSSPGNGDQASPGGR